MAARPRQKLRCRRAAAALPCMLAALLALLQGCASTGGTAPDRALRGGADAPSTGLYDQLSYWPLRDTGDIDELVCMPSSLIALDSTSGDETPSDLWERVRAGYAMEGEIDERRVEDLMTQYADRQALFDVVSRGASKYLYYVVERLEDRNMPLELALLPVVESGYNPRAVSPSQAAGLWQFIPGTAARYGLEQNRWYDGRKDVLASTDAALDYLEDLHQRFDGDWYLALAAYNAGEGLVSRAIERNRRQGKPTDYWSLKLPRQTCEYVPRLIAVARLLESPEDHGVALEPIPNEPTAVPVAVDGQINLRGALDAAGIDRNAFFSLNPGYKQAYTLPKASNRLLVPVDQEENFIAALESTPRIAAAHAERYRIRPGDTLLGIARLHETSPEALRAVNGLSGDRIRAGDTLLIPSEGVIPPHAFPTRTASAASGDWYVVRRGDSLWEIGRRAGISTQQLVQLNKLDPRAPLRVGQRLRLRGDPELGRHGKRRVDYRVAQGDSISLIAARFKLPAADIMRWNGLDAGRAIIRAGQSLVLYLDDRHTGTELASATKS